MRPAGGYRAMNGSSRQGTILLRRRRVVPCLLLLVVGSLAACRQDMHDQPRYDPLEGSSFFEDGRASRPLVKGTVARGHLEEDLLFHTGRDERGFAKSPALPISRELLDRGRERYDIYCSPCHDRTGEGNGLIVQRGYQRPSSFHVDRLREAAPGYFVHVMRSGFGVMPAYNLQVDARDRWAIAAYIAALQLSQHAALADAPQVERRTLEAYRD